jgi:hypothetical protein
MLADPGPGQVNGAEAVGMIPARPSPLSETAARLSGLVEYLSYEVGLPGVESWFQLTELSNPDLLAGWHAELAVGIGDRRVAAAYMASWLNSTLASVWLMPVLADRRLPLAALDDIAIHRNDEGWFDGVAVLDAAVALLPGDPLADAPSATIVPDADALLDALADRLLALGVIEEALREACPIGLPALWGSLADGIGGGALELARLMKRDRHASWRDVEEVISRVAARQPRLKTAPRPFEVPHDGDIKLFEVRGTCCLYYRTVENPDRSGEGYCTGCPLRTDESRLRILQDRLDGSHE